jgi:hypothetical protein
LRTPNLLIAAVLLVVGCVDAPITPEHILPDGQLRADFDQAGFSVKAEPAALQAVQIAAVLAAQAEGPLEDAAKFVAEDGQVHLHLRADRLLEPRSVLFVWTHGDLREEVPGVLAPTTTLALAASHPLGPDQRGMWRVEVFSVGTDGLAPSAPELLFSREFEVL